MKRKFIGMLVSCVLTTSMLMAGCTTESPADAPVEETSKEEKAAANLVIQKKRLQWMEMW